MTPERRSHLQRIFGGSVHLNEPERSAYLDQACASDADLPDRLIQPTFRARRDGDYARANLPSRQDPQFSGRTR